jgi:carboxy-cis,cis-muconate cyclase
MLAPPSSSPLPKFLVTTTRGSTPDVRGWLTFIALDHKGDFARDESEERFQTPTSGGKANALDLLSKQDGEGIWIVLTDDDEATFAEGGPGNGAVRVLEYNGLGTGVKEVAEWPTEHKEDIKGASHAIWLD